MRNARIQKLVGALLTLALALPLAGCVLEAEEHPDDVDAVEALPLAGDTPVEVSPAAVCTVRAFPPSRGTRYINGIPHDAVIGRAGVSCTSSTTLSVTAILWGDGSANSYANCNNTTACMAEVWAPYSPGAWYTEGVSGQAVPDGNLSAGRTL